MSYIAHYFFNFFHFLSTIAFNNSSNVIDSIKLPLVGRDLLRLLFEDRARWPDVYLDYVFLVVVCEWTPRFA